MKEKLQGVELLQKRENRLATRIKLKFAEMEERKVSK